MSTTAIDGSVIGGYRPADQFLLYTSLSHSRFWYTASVVQTGGSTDATYRFKGGAAQTGLSVGMEFDADWFYLRAELAEVYATSLGKGKTDAYGGAQLGIRW
jgi:hypothetical protein